MVDDCAAFEGVSPPLEVGRGLNQGCHRRQLEPNMYQHPTVGQVHTHDYPHVFRCGSILLGGAGTQTSMYERTMSVCVFHQLCERLLTCDIRSRAQWSPTTTVRSLSTSAHPELHNAHHCQSQQYDQSVWSAALHATS